MNELEALARKYNTDKRQNDEGQNIYHGYTDVYYQLFANEKYEYRDFLELGVREGNSHQMWEEFFPNAIIYGIDNFSEVAYNLPNKRIKVLKADQADENTILEYFKGITFDSLIDDGSHMNWHHQQSFRFLWPKLKSGGYYIIEDLATCYNRKFRETDDMSSSTLYWLESMRQNQPYSLYINSDELKNIMKEIRYISIVGELGIIAKK
jgi:demethylmacrocin O-methyltransferase